MKQVLRKDTKLLFCEYCSALSQTDFNGHRWSVLLCLLPMAELMAGLSPETDGLLCGSGCSHSLRQLLLTLGVGLADLFIKCLKSSQHLDLFVHTPKKLCF